MNEVKLERLQGIERVREEVAMLGAILGETIKSIAGNEAFAAVEQVRTLAWNRRTGVAESDQKIRDYISGLSLAQLRVIIRSFTIFMDLLNLTEDRQRVCVLRQRADEVYPRPMAESIGAAVEALEAHGMSATEAVRLLNQLCIDLVFTAHPTEAKRRSVRQKLRSLRESLARFEQTDSRREMKSIEQSMRAEMAKLWETDFIRPWRPSVMQEVERGLSIKPVLWEAVPKIQMELEQALQQKFHVTESQLKPVVRLGTWIGGDRDGHPGVTFDITKQTFQWLRSAAIDFHLKECRKLSESLSVSQRQTDFGNEIREAIDCAAVAWPELSDIVSELPPNELCRKWLSIIRWRLNQTASSNLDQDALPGAYDCSKDLRNDIQLLHRTLSLRPMGELIGEDVRLWMYRADAFGFHLASLDVRQDARVYREVMDELLLKAGVCETIPATEEARQSILLSSMDSKYRLSVADLTDIAKETLQLFELLRQVADKFESQALGGHVISMTAVPSDLLTVWWLWNHAELTGKGDEASPTALLPIIPLFETIDDLRNSESVMQQLLSLPRYREYLRSQSDQQCIMLGYSDSTKDGGYLSACWELYIAQERLATIARQHQVDLTFFHGRGGSLGRGGGPAARSILSLPKESFSGSIRITEQGEVLAERYDDPAIAYRHLEQLIWAAILASSTKEHKDNAQWHEAMDKMSSESFGLYRKFVEHPGFVSFFRTATPISEIEQLPIGSRPSRRRGGASLKDLRAIPWVFSWTQIRCLIPAWYGLGSAVERLVQSSDSALEVLRDMYREWGFFRACIDNAELALAKSDLEIARGYAALADDPESTSDILSDIEREFAMTQTAILKITGRKELLDSVPWLKESIRVRNRYIDPLNLIQIHLLKKSREESNEEVAEELRHLSRLAIKGVAAGMRTSG